MPEAGEVYKIRVAFVVSDTIAEAMESRDILQNRCDNCLFGYSKIAQKKAVYSGFE